MVGPRLVLVGRVAGAFGVKGEVRLTPFGDDPMALVRYRTLLNKDGTSALTLKGGRVHKATLITSAPEITSKEAADALRGLELYAPRDAFAPPEDEDEFYLTDLIGLAVIDTAGTALGRVKTVPNFGAGDLLEIQPPQGASYYLPFTRAVVPEVKVGEGLIVVDPPLAAEGEETASED